MDTKRERGSRMKWEIGVEIYTLLCVKQITNKSQLHSTGN